MSKVARSNIRHGVFAILIGAGLIVVLMLSSLVLNTERRLMNGAAESWTEQAFYEAPDNLPEDNPGQLLRAQKLHSAPNGIEGWRIMYMSTDKDGNDIAVTGLVAVPQGIDGSEKRTIVSWGHPTTGTAVRCAPSVGIDPFDSIEGLRDLISNGYIVTATDYSGMGIAGPPSFLIGETEGRNVLDSVRAAQQLLPNDTSSDVVLWGHSQGGHAALFAEQIASSYTPNLTIKGVATAAPATKLSELLQADSGDVSGVTIGSYAMQSYSTAYGANLNTILTEQGVADTLTMANYCLLGQNEKIHEIATPLIGKYFTADPSTVAPWSEMLEENTPGKNIIKAPLFVAQGEADELVHPEVTKSFVDDQEAFGASVTYVVISNTGHGMIALKAMPQFIEWINKL